jgi:hypothetical protein
MSKKIKFNSLLHLSKNAGSKEKHDYSLNLGAIIHNNDHVNSTQSDGYQISSDRTNTHSFRGIGGAKANALRTSYANSSFNLRN